MLSLRLIAAPLLLLTAATAQHPSFDCSKASTPREHTICNFPELSTADAKLAAAYTRELNRLTPASAQLIRADQRNWLHWLDLTCLAPKLPFGDTTTASCLQREYADRLTQFKPQPSFPGAPVFFTHTHFTAIPNSPEDRIDEQDPGYGVGTFQWPQIDNPTPAQAAWNQAIYQAALYATRDDKHKNPTSFDQTTDPIGSVNLSTVIIGANQHLITAAITNFIVGYGAAHPSTDVGYFSWWLDKNHALKLEDIFRPDADFTPLVPYIHAQLKANPDWGSSLWEKPNLPSAQFQSVQESIAKKLHNPLGWELTRTGLTLHFSQYEIGPYVIGMPETTIPWLVLKPFLKPSFNPAILPTRTTAPSS